MSKRSWWGFHPSSLRTWETLSHISTHTFLILFNSFWKKAFLERQHPFWLEILGLVSMVNICFSYGIIGLFWHCMWPYHLLLFILQRTEHRCLQRPRESGFFSIEHNGIQQKKSLAIDLPCHLQLLPPQCVYFLCLHRIVDSVCRREQSVCSHSKRWKEMEMGTKQESWMPWGGHFNRVKWVCDLLLTGFPERSRLQVFGAPYKRKLQKTFGPEGWQCKQLNSSSGCDLHFLSLRVWRLRVVF